MQITAMHRVSLRILLVVVACVGWWLWWTQDERHNATLSPGATFSTRPQAGGEPTLDSLLSGKARYTESDWDRLMERIIASDRVSFADKERAFDELSRMARLRISPWFFKIFSQHKSIEECLSFCEGLPFDSESQRAVTSSLVERILDECDLATAIGHISKMDRGAVCAISRLVDRDLPKPFHLGDVLEIKQRLPENWQRVLLLEVSSHSDSALSYRDLKALFQSGNHADILGRAITSLASKGALKHSDMMDVMGDPLISPDDKYQTVINCGNHAPPPTPTSFARMFATNLPTALVNTYVRSVAAGIEQSYPGSAASYGRSIPDPELRKYFYARVAAQWSLKNMKLDGNPYWDELGGAERESVRSLLALRPDNLK
ncbi:MAG: hypothetical protein J0M04_17800 [Verrucomicrobia bacterium]|nr:hypothetical protein [Verrucomicrobiota bacterium]